MVSVQETFPLQPGNDMLWILEFNPYGKRRLSKMCKSIQYIRAPTRWILLSWQGGELGRFTL